MRGGAAIGGSPAGKKKFGVELVADFVDHHAEVIIRRVCREMGGDS